MEKFKDLGAVVERATEIFGKEVPLTPLAQNEYSRMSYPKAIPFMRFETKRYAAEDFGNVFTMSTRAIGGLMRLATLVFTPNLGGEVPLLLIDIMALGKKRAVFIEYYDLTDTGANCPGLVLLKKRFDGLSDYEEKPAWYVGERADYSLIKGGKDDEALLALIFTSAAEYARLCRGIKRSEKNITKLRAFIERMVNEKNPSSATMERVLGEEGARRFFSKEVMPGEYTEK